MNLEKLQHSKLVHGSLLAFFTTAQWIGKHIGPYYARKRAAQGTFTIDTNQSIRSWDGVPVHLDIYTPTGTPPAGGWPVALMIHGGGWRFFSKDSHAIVCAEIAETGTLTIAMDYRLAPQHPYPLGFVDVCSVYDWLHQNAAHLNVNLDRIAITGESAGATFALSLSMLASGLATLDDLHDERFTESALGRKLEWRVPKKALIHCGYFHVSDAERYDGKVSTIVAGRLRMIRKNYLPQSLREPKRDYWGLADPLVILEKRAPAQMSQIREFPEVFIPVGDRDPVIEDSLRLDRALKSLGVKSAAKVYPQSPHALYAMPWHAQYQACWTDIRGFLRGMNI